MLFPTIVIDNFFDDTDSIIKHSNTLDYKALKTVVIQVQEVQT